MSDGARSLKVSYGAFSCTAEGFDDPFEAVVRAAATMARIAERDPAFVAAALRAAPAPAGGAIGDGGAAPAKDDPADGPADLSTTPNRPPVTTGGAPDALSEAIARITGGGPDRTATASAPRPPGAGPAASAAGGGERIGPGAAAPEAARADGARGGSDAVDDPADGPAATHRDTPRADAEPAADGERPSDGGQAAGRARGPADRAASGDVPDDAIERLMGTAGHRMEAPEASRRLSSLRRLRHAARAGADDLGRHAPGTDGDDRGAYAIDLDHATGAGGAGGAGGDRPAADPRRPGPLVLVSSQRVDPGAERNAGSAGGRSGARPRAGDVDGVPATDGPSPDPASLRAAFADRGAETLEDRMAVVAEAMDPSGAGFGRTALMDALRAADPDGFGLREERLRAFAALLQDGRLRRLDRGLYTGAAPASA